MDNVSSELVLLRERNKCCESNYRKRKQLQILAKNSFFFLSTIGHLDYEVKTYERGFAVPKDLRLASVLVFCYSNKALRVWFGAF